VTLIRLGIEERIKLREKWWAKCCEECKALSRGGGLETWTMEEPDI
jgi:hypothetical protein